MNLDFLNEIPVDKIIMGIVVFIGASWGVWKGLKKYLSVGASIAEKGGEIAEEISELLFASSDALKAANKVIKDDGTIEENSIEEALEAGKKVKIEFQDVIAEFKKK